MKTTEGRPPTLVLLVGVQGSGKSTFYRHSLASTHVLVSKDLLKNNRNRERRQSQLLAAYLAAGTNVVLDNTNVTAEIRKPLIELGKKWGAQIEAYWLDESLADCRLRNSLRDGKAHVPDGIIARTSRILQPPKLEEGFDNVYVVKINSYGTYSVQRV